MGFFEKLVNPDSEDETPPPVELNPLIAELPHRQKVKEALMAALRPDERVFDALSVTGVDKYRDIRTSSAFVVTDRQLLLEWKLGQLHRFPWGLITQFGYRGDDAPAAGIEVGGGKPTLTGMWFFVPCDLGEFERGVTETARRQTQAARAKLLLTTMSEAHEAFKIADAVREAARVDEMAAELRRKRGF